MSSTVRRITSKGLQVDVLDELRGGPIGHFGLESSVETINALTDYIYTWRNEKDAVLKDSDFSADYSGDYYVDLCVERHFVDAACSQTIVAAICPLFETLFSRAFSRIKKVCADNKTEFKNHKRWTLELEPRDEHKRWSPYWVFNEGDWPRRNLLEGYQNLLEAIGFETAIPKLSHEAQVLAALFMYRNKSLHHGYEWPSEVCNNLKRAVESLKSTVEDRSNGRDRWKTWFQLHSVGEEPCLITITKQFVLDAVASIKPIATKLREVEVSLKT